jgi:hypothetical protein
MEALFAGGRKGVVGPVRFWWLAEQAASTETSAPPPGTSTRSSGAGAATDAGAAVSVLFSVPKKAFKRAWRRNLIKRRMRESYRVRKHALADAAAATGLHIDIALVCSPPMEKAAAGKKNAGRGVPAGKKAAPPIPVPDFKTLDNAIEKILARILERS